MLARNPHNGLGITKLQQGFRGLGIHRVSLAQVYKKGRLTKKELIGHLSTQLGYPPTAGQLEAFQQLTDFLARAGNDQVFVLKGYAGTGKTTLVKAIVKTLAMTSLKTVLLAPTGRAAKVLSAYAGQPAWTIHKRIYYTESGSFGMQHSLQRNLFKKTLFIVDEASMIGNENEATEHSLIEDLIQYVQQGDDCRLMLIGDDAQLPPVGVETSPAIDREYLQKTFYLNVTEVRLHEVLRQAGESGILWNATRLREQIMAEQPVFRVFQTEGFPDFKRITGYELEDALQSAYSKYGSEEVLVITRSNKNAVQYNRQIRVRIHWQENEIAGGDQLMVVKNNYFWLDESSGPGFIANGDTLEISHLGKTLERDAFRFADARVRMLEYPDQPELEVRLMLNTLDSDLPSLPWPEQQKLQARIEEDYADVRLKADRKKAMRKDPFLQALQIKFAYAVTCHKAQGGQWKAVFVDQGYVTEEMMNKGYLRWLYTALTRATEKVYLVNFPDALFHDGQG